MYLLNKKEAMSYLEDVSYLEDNIKPEVRDDKEFIMLAVKKNGYYGLSLASDRLRDDKEVVIEAVKKDGNAIKYASKYPKTRHRTVAAAA